MRPVATAVHICVQQHEQHVCYHDALHARVKPHDMVLLFGTTTAAAVCAVRAQHKLVLADVRAPCTACFAELRKADTAYDSAVQSLQDCDYSAALFVGAPEHKRAVDAHSLQPHDLLSYADIQE
eukprot:8876-Heterococcus_DN1.PRE.1